MRAATLQHQPKQHMHAQYPASQKRKAKILCTVYSSGAHDLMCHARHTCMAPSGREPKVKALFDSKRAEYLAGKDGGKSAGQMKKELAQVCQGPDTCTVGWPGRGERIAPGGA